MTALPIILDTDIGDDIDDALALSLIVRSPELDLRGVTTVFRDAPRRALLARQVLRAFNRLDVPVAAGISRPLLQSYDRIGGGAALGAQFQELEEPMPDTPLPHAVDVLAGAAKVGEQLTIVPIGPLTNIAIALVCEPELASRARLVLMGGQWSDAPEPQRAEWNIWCDPEAAAIVFNSGIPITMVGLDVTLRCRLNQDHIAQIERGGNPASDLLSRLIGQWQGPKRHAVILHDPLAVLTLFDDCVTFEDKYIEVGLCGDERGKTIVRDGAPNARVAVDVDTERAVETFMARILG